MGFKTRAFVRAHPGQELTPTLLDCKEWGMALEFTDRKTYAELRNRIRWNAFSCGYPESYWLSEGGFSPLAIQGVEDIKSEVALDYDYIFVGCGSGATVCGLARAFPQSRVVGVAAFSGAEYLRGDLSTLLCEQVNNWVIDTEHHCGGFAKSTPDLEQLIQSIQQENTFELDAVYNGKVFLALQHWMQQRKLLAGSKVLVIHTGGLQGRRKG